MTFLISIVQIGVGDSIEAELYRRRVDLRDVNQLIQTLDRSMAEIKPPRAKRSDFGRSRKGT